MGNAAADYREMIQRANRGGEMGERTVDKHRWIELAAILRGGGMARNKYVHADDPEALEAWRNRFGNKDVFTSVCRFKQPSRDSGYTCDFFLDIDAEDLEEARESALRVCELLMTRLDIPDEAITVHFSGSKGFHGMAPIELFDGWAGPNLMQVWKSLALGLTKRGVKHIDLGIYQSARLWRLPNSINVKTDLYKVEVEQKELRDYSAKEIAELARRPRSLPSLPCPGPSEKAAKWFRRVVEAAERRKAEQGARGEWQGFTRGWRVPPCIRRIEKATLPDGVRHDAYLALSRFYGWIGTHPAEAAERIRAVDARNPIRDGNYIERVALYGHNHGAFPGCENPVLKMFCSEADCFKAAMDRKGSRRERHAWLR